MKECTKDRGSSRDRDADGNPNRIIDEFEVDPDLHIKAFKRASSPKWYLQYNDPIKGQRRQSLKTKSKKEARLRAEKIAKDIAAGQYHLQPARRISVEEMITRYMSYKTTRGCAPATLADYDLHLRRLLAFLPRGGQTPIDTLTNSHLDRLSAMLLTEGIKPVEIADIKSRQRRIVKPLGIKTTRDTLKSVMGLLKFARTRGVIQHDPAFGFELPKDEPKEIEVFTQEELAALLDGEDPVYAELWVFYLETCLRAEEMMWLTHEDVVMEEGRAAAVLIRDKTCPQTGERWWPKHKQRRRVPLQPRAQAIVETALATSKAPWLFEAPDTKSRQVGMWKYGRLRRHLQKRLAMLGLPHRALHAFRHTGATLLANAPVNPMPLNLLQEFLGHRNLKETQRYLRATPRSVQDAIQRVKTDYQPQNQQKEVA